MKPNLSQASCLDVFVRKMLYERLGEKLYSSKLLDQLDTQRNLYKAARNKRPEIIVSKILQIKPLLNRPPYKPPEASDWWYWWGFFYYLYSI